MANFSIPIKKKSRIIPILIVVGILAIGGGGYFYWQSTNHNKPSQQRPSGENTDSELSFSDQLNGLMGAGKYDEALALVDRQDDAASDPQMIMLRADILAKKGDVNEANKALSEAEGNNNDRSYEFKRAKARILAREGDTAGAIALYEEAIDLGMKATPTTNEIDRFEHNNMISDYRWELEQLRKGN